MDIPEIERGMVVELKSGGPHMTVRSISGDFAYCEWFTEADRRQGTFLLSTLKTAVTPDQSSSPPPEGSDR